MTQESLTKGIRSQKPGCSSLHHWEVLNLSLDIPEPRALSSPSQITKATGWYQQVPYPCAIYVTPAQGALSLGDFPMALSQPQCRWGLQILTVPRFFPPTFLKEWPKISKQGLCVVTSKRVETWLGFQLVKCHYSECWAMFSSLTPGFSPRPSLLGCWHGSQPPSWHRSFVLGWLRKGFLVAPDL